MDEYICYEWIREFVHEMNERMVKVKLEAPNLLWKEFDLKVKDINDKLEKLKFYKQKILKREDLPPAWEEEFIHREEVPVVTTYQDRLVEDDEEKRRKEREAQRLI